MNGVWKAHPGAETIWLLCSSGLGCISIGATHKAFLSWLKVLDASVFQNRDLAPCFSKEVRGEQIILKLLMNLL